MSFEAVPCMFQSTATDGSSGSYIGLLIRPSSSGTSATQAPTVIPAVVAPSINVQKAPHVVPSTVLKIPYTPKPAKAAGIPTATGVLRLQPTAYTAAPQYDPWVQKTSQPSVTAFDSSSSQVIPQMNTGDAYNAVSCPTTTSFFPPIASIAQGFSSGKSNLDLLQEASSSRSQNQKVQSTYCEYNQNDMTSQRYSTVTVQDNRFAQLPVEIPSSRLSSCKYQSGYNGSNECSATPDSGIQSIGDSPRSVGPFVTPMPSPASFIAMPSGEANDSTSQGSTGYDDFSDMPRLVPYHEIEEACSSNSEEAPQITDTTKSENEETGHPDPVPKISITPSVNVNELVEQLMSHLCPEQRKQFADAIKSKVVEECERGNRVTTGRVQQPNDACGSVEEEIWEPIVTNDFEPQRETRIGGKDQPHCSEIQSPLAECDISCERETSLGRMSRESWQMQRVNEFEVRNSEESMRNEEDQQYGDGMAFECQIRADGSEEESRKRSEVLMPEEAAKFYEVGNSSESSPKERVVEIETLDNSSGSPENSSGSPEVFEENVLSCQNDDDCGENDDCPEEQQNTDDKEGAKKKKRKTSPKVDRVERKKAKLKLASRPPAVIAKKKVKKVESRKKSPNVSRQSPVQEEKVAASCARENETYEDENTKKQTLEEESKQRLCAFRLSVKKQLEKQLNTVLEKAERQLSDITLDLGPRLHWELPWYRLNWKEVAQRIAERNRMEKIAREKNANIGSVKKECGKKTIKRSSSKKNSSVPASVSPCSTKSLQSSKQEGTSFTTIKHNLITDAYPKAEQMTCSCKTGSCSDKDQCLNRMVRMECTNTCPRGKMCSNRRILKRESVVKLKTFETSNGCGTGVKACEDLKKGQLVCEYVGEVVSVETFNVRRKLYDNRSNHYALNLCPGFVIDANGKGNIARYINHSCSPNCELQRWTVNGQHRIGVFALRNITKGDEITYDYNWCAFNLGDLTTCSCASPNCRRFLNKNLLMTSKEKKLVIRNRLLLLRNVEKSAKRKILAVQTKQSQIKQAETKKADHLFAIRAFCDEALAVFSDSGLLTKKQFSAFNTAIVALITHGAERKREMLLEEVEAEMQNALDLVAKADKKKFETLKAKLFSVKTKFAERLRKYGPLPQSFEEKYHGVRRKGHNRSILTATTDLSYLDDEVPAGSYDPDSTSDLTAIEADSDCVRCICGITDDDGSMIQCDTCHFWLHDDCVYASKPTLDNAEFTCDFCKTSTKRTPAVAISLRSEPEIRLAGCTYYRTLVNSRNIQVRLNETVYTQKLANDDHKAELKRLSEASKESQRTSKTQKAVPKSISCKSAAPFQPSAFSRGDLRCFRVERLFVSPEGHKFVFGSHYARPHEVYCEPGRMFHKKELFATSMFDTLPLDAVVGRCLVLEPRIYCLGRPKMPRYNEADVYFYEFQQTGKNSRYFEKIPSRNHYYINTEPHNFIRFPKELPLERSFTPFVIENPEHSRGVIPHGESSETSTKRPSSVARRCKQAKTARLEKLVQKLATRNSGHRGGKSAEGSSKRSSISPPRKRFKH